MIEDLQWFLPDIPKGKGTWNSKGLRVKKTGEWGLQKWAEEESGTSESHENREKQALRFANKEALMENMLILTRGQKGPPQKNVGNVYLQKNIWVLNRLTLVQALNNSKAFCFRPPPSIPFQEWGASQLEPSEHRGEGNVWSETARSEAVWQGCSWCNIPPWFFGFGVFGLVWFGLTEVLFLIPIKSTLGLWDSAE